MLLVQDKLISSAVVETQFACHLEECKGACCWEGDSGAPLEVAELAILEEIYEKVKPFLRPEGIAALESQGLYVQLEDGEYATTLVNNQACAYLTYDPNGIAKCGIEKAWEAGAVQFKKPISCHLYPIRLMQLADYEALNYESWEICAAACQKGKTLRLPVYQFVKEALIRRYGEAFYEELDAAANFFLEKRKK